MVLGVGHWSILSLRFTTISSTIIVFSMVVLKMEKIILIMVLNLIMKYKPS